MFSFVKNRFLFYTIALVLVLISIILPFATKLNLGIDMTGGIQVEYKTSGVTAEKAMEMARNTLIDEAKKKLGTEEAKVITDTLVYGISGTENFVIEAGVHEEGVDPKIVESAKSQFITELQKGFSTIKEGTIEQARYVNVGASFGAYIKKSGYITLTLAIIAISLYIQYAFRGSIAGMASWPFALVTGVSLLHDVVIASGLYILTSIFFPEFKIDTFFITALLTVLGYSINDTIVVMDRIRSNLQDGTQKKLGLPEIIDKSIHDTMRRSLFTSLTVIIVLVALFIWGPSSLKGFTLALIFGSVVGTYSSICIASPLLIDITKRK